MASQVPYTGVPTVTPSLPPAPERRIDTPFAAFGGLTAQAISHLGQAEDTAGNEIFARGIAMQQLNQQADANAAVADYQGKLTNAYIDYTSNMGGNAVRALPKFQQDMEELRQSTRENLTSDYARKAFDGESRGAYWRTIFSAAIHAKDQNRRYVTDTNTALIQSSQSAALAMPEDEESFRSGLERTKSAINNTADVEGWSPEKRQQEINNATGGMWANRIQGIAHPKPFEAQKMLDNAVKNGDIDSATASRLSDYVGKIKATVGARNLAGGVMAGDQSRFGETILDQNKARIGIKGVEGGNYTASVLNPDGDHALGAYQIMGKNLQPWLKEAGMASMTEAEFLRSPDAQDKLFDFKFGQYMQQYGTANRAALAWFTGKPDPDPNVRDKFGTTPSAYLTKFNAALAHNASLGDLVKAGSARATEADLNDPLLPDITTHYIKQLYNDQIAVRRDAEFNNNQTIAAALYKPDEAGKLPGSVDELTKDPAVKVVWNAMNATDQNKVRHQLEQNAMGPRQPTNESLVEFKRLIGERDNQPSDFIQEDVIANDKLTQTQKGRLIDMQSKAYKGAQGDPRLGHAMQVMAPTLQAAGLTPKDKDNYNLYTGEMHDLIQTFMDDNKRPPKDNEIQEIGTRLLQQQATRSFFGLGAGQSELYRLPVPSEAAEAIRSSPAWVEKGYDKLDGAVQDRLIQRAWTQAQYQQLYSRPSRSQQPQASQPQVPQR